MITFILVRLGGVGTVEIGQVLYVLSIVTVLSLLTDFGMTEGLQKFVNQVSPKKIILPAICLEFVIVTLTALTALILDFNGWITKGEQLLFFVAVVMSSYNIIVLIFNGLHQQLRSSIYQVCYVTLLVSSLSVYYFFFNLPPLTSALLAFSVSWLMINGVMLLDLGYQGLLSIKDFEFNKDFIFFCLNNFIYVCGFMVLTQTDTLFINNILGDSATGIYKSSAQIALFSRVIGLSVATPLLPIFAKKVKQKDIQGINRILRMVLVFMAAIIGSLISVSFFLGSEILFLIYNNSQIASQGGFILFLLLIAFGIQNFNLPIIMLLQAVGLVSVPRNTVLVQAFLYIIPVILFTSYGIWLPALVLACVEVIALFVYLFHLYKLGFFKLHPTEINIQKRNKLKQLRMSAPAPTQR